jgi:hypothetical protein
MTAISNLYRRNMSATAKEKVVLSDSRDAEGMAYDLKDLDQAGLEKALMQTIASTLQFFYPPPKGLPFWWGVEVNGSVTYIFNLALSGRHAYLLHTANVSTDRVKQAAGEILERFRVPRDYRKYDAATIIELHANNNHRFLNPDK